LSIGTSPSDVRVGVYRPILKKDANDVAGIVELIDSNRQVRRWMNQVYLPWFNRVVLNPMVAKSSS
jgi:hypothetical protein